MSASLTLSPSTSSGSSGSDGLSAAKSWTDDEMFQLKLEFAAWGEKLEKARPKIPRHLFDVNSPTRGQDLEEYKAIKDAAMRDIKKEFQAWKDAHKDQIDQWMRNSRWDPELDAEMGNIM
ncbi:hypothetical protein C8R46DRAFT_1358014 [Mycena filopes]|nr:hypothetical protein C8R46DRAFT_1358014 [Mycena filopes]